MTSVDQQADDDDEPRLSDETLKIIEEFYAEQFALMVNDKNNTAENWQLSQFWYNKETTQVLANSALIAAGDTGRIACISCPTVYKELVITKSNEGQVFLFEYDKRFSTYGESYVFYDFNEPLNLRQELRSWFDLVIADPPFLSVECLEKTAQTIKFLAKDKIILCTGAVMQDKAKELLGVTPTDFRPQHVRNLANEFLCYSNFSFPYSNNR